MFLLPVGTADIASLVLIISPQHRHPNPKNIVPTSTDICRLALSLRNPTPRQFSSRSLTDELRSHVSQPLANYRHTEIANFIYSLQITHIAETPRLALSLRNPTPRQLSSRSQFTNEQLRSNKCTPFIPKGWHWEISASRVS